ncbi:hypothetical protein R1sor_017684 [Riccia sorocarpa]|uniref:DUF7869 domain-containing protein n=1 Tax=Riccia sorocarpa TaxID=122646 RepID=A0ABD3I7M6_9MARC
MYRHKETVREGRSKKTMASTGSGRVNPAEQQKRFTKDKLDEAVLGLKLHRQQQGEERATGGRCRNKALNCPEEAAYISIDGMDQNKTILPHFVKVSKSVDAASLVGVHLVGAMIYHGTFRTKVFATYKNVRSDSNLTISIIHRIVSDWEGPLPPTLYLQLDNTVRENKNANVFAYLAMLIDRKVFLKVKVGFLMVGHTYDHVDQMFSRFSMALRHKQAFTMPQLQAVIQDSYTPSPSFEVLEETWDFKTILQTEPTPVLSLHDMRAAPLVAMKSHNVKRPKGVQAHVIDAVESFNRIKKDIQTSCFSYFSEVEQDWWHNWFLKHEYYATQTKTGGPIPLIRQWQWRAPQDEDLDGRRRQLPSTLVTSGEIEKRVFGERRPAYAGPRKSRPGTAEHDRIHRLGDLKDLSPGQMVTVLAEDDKSFWVCKVLKVKTRSEDGEGSAGAVEVQWFATEAEDPYVGKYYPEKRKGDGRSRPVLFKQTLLLSEIRILAFDFSLTAAHRLRKSTASHIRTQLFRLEQEVAVEEAQERNSGSQENRDTENNGVNEEEVNDDS